MLPLSQTSIDLCNKFHNERQVTGACHAGDADINALCAMFSAVASELALVFVDVADAARSSKLHRASGQNVEQTSLTNYHTRKCEVPKNRGSI